MVDAAITVIVIPLKSSLIWQNDTKKNGKAETDRRGVLLSAQLKEEEGNLVQDHDKKEEADLDHSLTNQCIIPSF